MQWEERTCKVVVHRKRTRTRMQPRKSHFQTYVNKPLTLWCSVPQQPLLHHQAHKPWQQHPAHPAPPLPSLLHMFPSPTAQPRMIRPISAPIRLAAQAPDSTLPSTVAPHHHSRAPASRPRPSRKHSSTLSTTVSRSVLGTTTTHPIQTVPLLCTKLVAHGRAIAKLAMPQSHHTTILLRRVALLWPY